ncbi:hypothetical protein [Streptomyces sp. NPDC059753]|uniref:hypothetical protein n=1 Tax=Streptomyces sp. NPDC059753 TaxID=3346933 RepID=UPI00365EFE30
MALEPPTSPPQGEAAPSPHSGDLVGDEPLPCGRHLRQVWEQAGPCAPAPDTHATCPHCTQARQGLAALNRATAQLRAMDRPPACLLAARIVAAVQAEVRLGSLLLDDPGQDLRITETAAAKTLRAACDTVPGVLAGSCRITPVPGTNAAHVTLTVATGLDRPLPERSAQVRAAVRHAAGQFLGLAVSTVDVRIASVLDLPAPAPHRDGEAAAFDASSTP